MTHVPEHQTAREQADDSVLRVASDRRAQSKVDARARAALVLLAGFLSLVVLSALGLIVWLGLTVRENQEQIKALVRQTQEQARDVQEVLDRQTANDKNRQRVIGAAVAKIAADQRAALAEHDRRTEALLRRTLMLTEREVFGSGNQESGVPAAAPPRPAPAPAAVAPRTTTRPPAPRPAPAPAPAPAPCQPVGKSGKCRK